MAMKAASEDPSDDHGAAPATDGVLPLFDGQKNYPALKIHVEYSIVEHVQYNCIEVIGVCLANGAGAGTGAGAGAGAGSGMGSRSDSRPGSGQWEVLQCYSATALFCQYFRESECLILAS